jgi:hypothetical protein
VRRRNRKLRRLCSCPGPSPVQEQVSALPGCLTSCRSFLAMPAVICRNLGDPSRLVRPVSVLSPSGNREEPSQNLQPPQTPPQIWPQKDFWNTTANDPSGCTSRCDRKQRVGGFSAVASLLCTAAKPIGPTNAQPGAPSAHEKWSRSGSTAYSGVVSESIDS